ncbi:MAG: YajQ family cyclic di-GMP-binding protein [Clostridium argentinense]|uniref:YajQ family cyclic di-GMP-binding protein n=1 Tax=Clostridium butanoliproducens TaxID=2991837 RepID=UPI001DE31F88|nr:YajQ family cyclic di-GMP-binding protein [Clostridium butanoliproducens]MBS5825315.1 YajQ family cyclic di-GMP-binding protein [Clostridium argentinense]MDU1348740.1 YajQ family cyclic di-GMP-binding protein [Clostridium argentinense]
MASNYSFDIVSEVNMQEVDNAVNQTLKEIGQRYDFKGSKTQIELGKDEIKIVSDDEYKLNAVIDVLKGKFIRRGVSPKALELGKIEDASLGSARVIAKIVKGISTEKAKKIVAEIKASKIKVQTQIMDNQLRVTGKNKDDLQEVIQLVKSKDFGIDLQFTNYR